ncbi:AraC family transcriptional regulator [Nocardia sp. NPDC051832]|uniref:AraC family transcriptional regulator n=1 Tax=Nocardia sp. NPDC051832 TaxID=3155673 RepID=UPI003448CF0A
MVVMTRAAGLRGYAELVDELGGDGVALLARFGITPAALDSDDALVSAESTGWALQIAAAELDCPDFGLRLAERQDSTVLGPLSIAIANAETIGDAIRCAARYLFVHHPGISVALVPDPEGRTGTVALNYRDPGEANGIVQGVDLAAATIHAGLRRAAGGDYGLRTVYLPHPPLAPARRYTEYFGAAVRFDAETTLFRIPSELLTRPVMGNDRTLRTIAMDYLARNYSELTKSMTARVRVAIDQSFTQGKPDIDVIAKVLAMHERSLQRALAEEGTTFSEVLDGARRDAAYRLLRETEMTMTEITILIGLGEQSALTRAVRRWFGATPQQVRAAARAERGHGPRVLVSRKGSALRFATGPEPDRQR